MSLKAFTLLFACFAADPSLPSAEAVRRQYLATVSSLHTLECRYVVDQPDLQAAASIPEENRYTRLEHVLLRDGTRRALTQKAYNPAGLLLITSWEGYDGKTFARHNQEEIDRPRVTYLSNGLLTSERINSLYDSLSPDKLWGEGLGAGTVPLSDLLTNENPRVIQWAEVDGFPCVEVAFDRHRATDRAPDQRRMETTVWLDPAHGYLPRRIRQLGHSTSDDSPPSEINFKTTRYEMLSVADGTIPFPWEGESVSRLGNIRLRVTEATSNRHFPLTAFQPAFPEGTFVREELAGRPPRTYVIGKDPGPERLERRREGNHEKAVQQASLSTSPPPSARPERQSNVFPINRIISGSGVLLLLTALAIVVRRSRRP